MQKSEALLTYLAAPYRHLEESVRDARLEAVSRVASELTELDRRVFCPLTYAASLLENGFGFRDDEWWYDYDLGWLSHCTGLVVLTLPGWAGSKGVRLEIETAESWGIPISYMDPPDQFAGLTRDKNKDLHRRLLSLSHRSAMRE